MSDLDTLFENAPDGAVELRENTEHGYLRWFDKDGDTWSKRDNGFVAEYSDYKTIATRPQPEQATRFKVGDKVKRVRGVHLGMHIGDCSKVISLHGNKAVSLDGYGGTHSPDMLEIVHPEQPRKTVEDAVEHFNKVWPCEGGELWYEPEMGWLTRQTKYADIDAYKVCNQSEFEACVAANSEPHFKATRENLKKIAKDAKSKSEPEWTHCTSLGKCRVLIDIPDEHGYVVIERDGEGYSLVPPRCLKPIKPTISKSEAWDKLTKLNGKYQNMDTMTAIMTLCGEYEVVA
jgi:hypothetical protein